MTKDSMPDVAQFLKERRKLEYQHEIIAECMLIVKQAIAQTVNEDTHIVQAVNAVEELDRICNVLTKRLREWYGYYFPELNQNIADNEVFAKRIIQKTKAEFMEEYSIRISMGPDISEKDLESIYGFARQINGLFTERENLINYIEDIMKKYCINVWTLTGTLIGAKLLEKAGSLRKLSLLPSSTIQLLGAEQALFRHLRNKKARPPKHGLILSHPYVMNANRNLRGAKARALAAKISIAAKVDYFKGEFVADKLKERLK